MKILKNLISLSGITKMRGRKIRGMLPEQDQILCPVCNNELVTIDKQLGYLPCKSCQERQSQIAKPSEQIEFTSESIKEGRRKFFKSTIQPWRDNRPSLEYAQAYPERAKKKFAKYKKSEIKEVWKDITPGGGWGRTE